ncbi:hypothetical protein QGN32_16965 [Mycolicibacterium sp. ND9-15]|uniref:alpha/beta hydrolase family protein n=1 Tax=Mycolicibacterium sp. ND9-15 TaxID=3042320 RepID=UPI002DDA0016|nr:hypothetical protein [Mycolicibacterium sp. ND9-15]WSE55129.1 hypothetical protein QGN32_16965 [Mycolicibacterium sp. ND9-15]
MAAPDHDDTDDRRPSPPLFTPSGGGLGNVFGPLERTGRFYAEAWRDYFERTDSDIPVARPTLSLATHAFRDEIVLLGLRARRPLSDPDTFSRITREAAAAVDFYQQMGWLDDPTLFFAPPPALADIAIHRVKSRRHSHQRMVFDSGYVPDPREPGAERWLSYTSNRRCYALMLRHREPAPWLVCVHGAEMGRAALDLTLFRAQWLHRELGLNVVLPVLPMHGPRARGLPKGAVFPGEDILDDVHAAAQAVWDVRRLLSWIRSQEPDAPIGLNGISLGGYVSSLVASLEEGLTCAVLGVPVVDLVELLGRHAGFRRDDPRRDTIELAEPLGRMTSPLSLTPRVPMRGRFVYAGLADRLVHPREQVVRLWEHWGRPEIVWYRGGHTGFFEARPVQRFIEAALVQSGLVKRVSAQVE